MSRKQLQVVYFLQQGTNGPIKIGLTTTSLLDSRTKRLQTGSPYPLELLGIIEGGQALERQIQEQFAAYRLEGEWFQSATDLLQFINTHAEQPGDLDKTRAMDVEEANLISENEPQTRRWSSSNAAGLGKRASFLLTTLSGQNKAIFTTEEAHQILSGSRPAVYKLMHDLVQGGWLHSLGKGHHVIIPLKAGLERLPPVHEFVIAHHLAPEGYVAYWTALHHHGLTEQIPRTVWIATPGRRREATVAGVRYVFVTLRPYKVFGQQPIWIEGQSASIASIADLEKSVADALDHPEHSGGIGEVAKALATAMTERDADLERLTEYALRMRNRAIFKRLGYLAEALSLPPKDLTKRWQVALSAGYAKLDPSLPASGSFDRRWRVQVNVLEAELTGWMET